MRYLVTITDNIAPTSMPYNEFSLYRSTRQKEEKQILLLLFKTNISTTIAENIEFHTIGKDPKALRATINDLVARAKSENATIVFHIHEAKSVLLFNIATKGNYKRQIVYTLHSTYKNYPFHNKLFAQLASRQCGKVVCVSKTSYKYYPSALKKALKDKVCYIQNGVDIARIDHVLENSKKEPNDSLTLIYVARFIELKRHKLLFDILQAVPNIKLKLIGSGSLEEELKSYAKQKNIDDRVEFVGSLQRDEVYKTLFQSDVYVSTSSYEGLPVSVLEAMRCNLPCVLSDIEQHRELAEHCPELALCDDSPTWIATLNALTKSNDLEKIGLQNARNVKEYFSLDAMHKHYDLVYSSLEKQTEKL